MSHITSRKGGTVFLHSKANGGGIMLAMDRSGKVIDLKQKMTIDEASDIVDSAFACRVIEALRAKLEPDEVHRVLQILVNADLISQEESRDVSNEIDEEANGPRREMAEDAMFPHRNRLGPPLAVPLGHKTAPASTVKQRESRDQMFPDYGRLKA